MALQHQFSAEDSILYRNTQVFEAILRADLRSLTKYDAGLDMIRDQDGWNCLHFATLAIAMAQGRSKDPAPDGKLPGLENARAVFQLLVEQGCNPDSANLSGVRPIHLAAWYGLSDVIDALLRLAVHVDPRANDMYKSRWYEAPRSGLKKLLRLDSDIYRPDTFIVGTGVTPLYLAARAGHADIIRKLVRAGANVNTAKDFGEQTGITALHAACAKGNRDAVLALLEANCELNPRSSDGGTPLHCACEFAHEDVVDVLLGGGDTSKAANSKRGTAVVDVRARKVCVEAHGVTALHMATAVGSEPIVKKLLAAGAEVNAQASDGFSPLHLASQNGNVAVARVLLDAGCNVDPEAAFEEYRHVTPLHLAVRQGHNDMVDLLLAAKANFRAVESIMDVEGITVLHLSAMYGHSKLASKFISLGLAPNIKTSVGVTPLFLAVKEGHEAVVSLLLETSSEAKADMLASQHSASDIGLVHMAVMRGHIAVVKQLAVAGCSVNQSVMSDNGGLVSPLYLAVDKRNVAMVKTLLELGANPDDDLRDGFTVLHTAAEQGLTDIVAALLKNGHAAVEKQATFGDLQDVRPIHLAAMNGHCDVATVLGKARADINAMQSVSDVTMTPLYIAVKNRDAGMVRALIDAGCDVNGRRSDGWSPLHLACEQGFADAVKLMINASVDVNVPASIEYNTGVQPIHQASQEGHVDIVRMLIDAGASVNAAKSWRGETGITALHLAAEAGHTEVVRLLLERCANASSAKRSGWTALHWAAQNGSLDIMRILLQHGADVLAVASYDDHRNCQPIHQAAQHGRTQAVELLLKHGAKVNVSKTQGTTSGITPFHLTAAMGHTDTARVLMTHGADMHVTDSNGFTALHFAAQNAHVDVCRLLLATNQCDLTKAGSADRYADTLPIHSAAMGGNVSIIKFLAIAGSSLEAGRREGDRTGVHPLHVCAEHGHVKAVQALADLGADLNATDSFAFTPLHLAASEGHADVIECLLRAGANARVTADFHNERGVTPLHLAVRFGHKKAVSALLPTTEASDGGAAGATGASATCDVNATQSAETITGYTALHIAATEGHVTIARLLLKAGANPQLKISTGKTAYDLAKNKGFTDVMKIIKFTKVGKEQ